MNELSRLENFLSQAAEEVAFLRKQFAYQNRIIAESGNRQASITDVSQAHEIIRLSGLLRVSDTKLHDTKIALQSKKIQVQSLEDSNAGLRSLAEELRERLVREEHMSKIARGERELAQKALKGAEAELTEAKSLLAQFEERNAQQYDIISKHQDRIRELDAQLRKEKDTSQGLCDKIRAYESSVSAAGAKDKELAEAYRLLGESRSLCTRLNDRLKNQYGVTDEARGEIADLRGELKNAKDILLRYDRLEVYAGEYLKVANTLFLQGKAQLPYLFFHIFQQAWWLADSTGSKAVGKDLMEALEAWRAALPPKMAMPEVEKSAAAATDAPPEIMVPARSVWRMINREYGEVEWGKFLEWVREMEKVAKVRDEKSNADG